MKGQLKEEESGPSVRPRSNTDALSCAGGVRNTGLTTPPRPGPTHLSIRDQRWQTGVALRPSEQDQAWHHPLEHRNYFPKARQSRLGLQASQAEMTAMW